MKIAIPLFDERISPRFDCAPSVLLITAEDHGKRIMETHTVVLQDSTYIERINRLKKLGADVVICGGISTDMQDLLQAKEITVIPWVTGNARDALQLFLEGGLAPGTMLCPGRRPRRWRLCRQGCNRGSKKGRADHIGKTKKH